MTNFFRGSENRDGAEADGLRELHPVSPFLVDVLQFGTDEVVLRDSRGITARLHTSIIRDNGLESLDGRLVLPGAVYRHYFGKREWDLRMEREARELKLLRSNIKAVLAAADRILATPQLAAAYSTAWFTGGIPVGIRYLLSIGSLAEYWKSGDMVQPCPECGRPAYAYHLIGSFMSGRSSAQAVCPACDSAVTFHPWRGPTVGRMTWKMRAQSQVLEVGQKRAFRVVYPTRLRVPTGPFPAVQSVVQSLAAGATDD